MGTTINISALCCAVVVGRYGTGYLLRIVAAFAIGSGYTYSFVGGSYILNALFSIPWGLYLILMVISVFNTAFSRDELARLRCFVNIILWTIMFATVLLEFAQSWIYYSQYNIGVMTTLYSAITWLRSSLYCSFVVLLVVAHCKMRQVVSQYSTSVVKPPLVVTVEEFAAAMCYYVYPLLPLAFCKVFIIDYMSDVMREDSKHTSAI